MAALPSYLCKFNTLLVILRNSTWATDASRLHDH